MKILMTGATGLIGSRLVCELHAAGHEITELRRYDAARGLKKSPWDVSFYDLRGGGHIPEKPYDVVLHLGAMASNTAANEAPVEAFDIIATGTMRLIDAIDRMDADPVFVLASSSEVYADYGKRAALNPYAAAKIAAEEAVTSSRFDSVIVRPFNTYGRANVGSPVSVVDKWVVAALTVNTIVLGNNMHVVRDFLWREDHVNGYLALVDEVYKRQWGDHAMVEFGTGQGIELWQVLDAIKQHIPNLQTVEGTYERPNDVPVLLSNPADWLYGWQPTVDFDEGVALTLKEWMVRLGA